MLAGFDFFDNVADFPVDVIGVVVFWKIVFKTRKMYNLFGVSRARL